jgi:glycosyltransferase involved in cell wall biosynthesis
VPRKGLKELLAAIAQMPRPSRPVLVTIGAKAPEVAVTAHRHLGMIHDDAVLAQAYSAADAVIVPSLQENLPNTALEAIACGTPVVGFDVGGIPDIVRPDDTGLLAPAGDETALSAAIARLLDDRALRQRLSGNCRRVAVQEYDPRQQALRYLELYRSMV